jgi:hypothetical protein
MRGNQAGLGTAGERNEREAIENKKPQRERRERALSYASPVEHLRERRQTAIGT